MLGYVRNAMTRPLVRLWLASSQDSWRQLPTPADAPIAHSPGAEPDRILLVGSGIAVGYGVLSHELALGGAIARSLAAGTGRGADIETIAARELSPSAARAILTGSVMSRFDALVLTLGGAEALYLTPRATWRRQLQGLFEHVTARAPHIAVFVVSVPPLPQVLRLPRLHREVASRHAVRLNQDTRALVRKRAGFHFVDFSPRHYDIASDAGRQMYQEWGALIAPSMVRPLNERAPAPPQFVDEAARQKALELLEIGPGRDERFDRIVVSARDLFEVSGASVNFIDGDHQWVKAAVGMPKWDLPRQQALCNITIRRPGLFVIEDLRSDSRFAGSVWARDPHAPRFYAGYPVAAPDGHRVGALCVVDRRPRRFVDAEAALLRELALRVQALLWGETGH
jgi:hypothetical protein